MNSNASWGGVQVALLEDFLVHSGRVLENLFNFVKCVVSDLNFDAR